MVTRDVGADMDTVSISGGSNGLILIELKFPTALGLGLYSLSRFSNSGEMMMYLLAGFSISTFSGNFMFGWLVFR